MKKRNRILALVFVVILAVSLLSTLALAAVPDIQVYGKETVVRVNTDKKPWYALLTNPKVKITNTGDCTMHIFIDGPKAKTVYLTSNRKHNNSTTIKLEPNSSYTIYIDNSPYHYNINGVVSAQNYIQSMKGTWIMH